jgi:HSP20 family molecular chaperone IbpA
MVEPFAPWLRRFNQILHNQGTVSAFIPPADLVSDDDGVTVYPDVPGLRAENLQIELENDTLTIRGERSSHTLRRTEAVRCAGSTAGSEGLSAPCASLPV